MDGRIDAPVMWLFTYEAVPRSLIVRGDLVDAVREEYGAAVAAHWGAVREKVWRWRRVLGVSLYAGGTHALM
jgi:hypothetical protein